MHWFWRAVIAVVVAAGVLVSLENVIESLERDARFATATALGSSTPAVFAPDGSLLQASEPSSIVKLWPGSRRAIQRALRIGLQNAFALVLCLATYGVLTRTLGPRVPSDGHLRCRKYQHILRGLTEPRCPECGEAI